MTVQITHVRFGSTPRADHTIVAYRWLQDGTAEMGQSDKPTMIEWMTNSNGEAYVGSGAARVPVGVCEPSGVRPYLRTYADGEWTNNLAELPEF